MRSKYTYIGVILSLCVLFGCIYKLFIGTGLRYDVFLFYDYPNGGRLLTNILNDISQMTTITIVLLLWSINCYKKEILKLINPFLIICILDIVDYFLFYKQYSVVKLPLLIVLLILYNYRYFNK